MPRHDIIIEGQTKARWPNWGDPPTQARSRLRACGARPSAGWTIQGKMALRGKARDDAKGDFLGGTRSARPYGTAVLIPRHDIINRGANESPVAQRGDPPTQARSRLRACGARPSAGWTIQGKMALRGKARDDAKGDFLGGARSPRPRGKAILMPRHDITIGGKRKPSGPMGAILRCKQGLVYGRAEPALPP